MSYYIGCNVPRPNDCEDGRKCHKGTYCEALCICSAKEELLKNGFTPLMSYYDKNGNFIFFNNQEQAIEYLEEIKLDKF